MSKPVFIKESNRERNLIRITLFVEQWVLDAILTFANENGLPSAPEKAIPYILTKIAEEIQNDQK
ncbi:hypothetical protein DRP05_12800 [Archaeoglobales archaeon]|nr:MAG: hypothetical protein DRP05_12800 [Archaeoglobales archaeon]